LARWVPRHSRRPKAAYNYNHEETPYNIASATAMEGLVKIFVFGFIMLCAATKPCE
jgi:hypothetical protein